MKVTGKSPNGKTVETASISSAYFRIASRLDNLPDDGWQFRVALLFGGVIFVGGLPQYFGSAMQSARLETGLTTLDANALSMAFTMFGYLVGSLLMGFLSDLKGHRAGVMVSLAISSSAQALMVFVSGPEMAVFLRAVSGIGLGGGILASYCAMAEYTPPHCRGKYAAMVGMVGSFSLPLSGLYTLGLLPHLDWRMLYVIASILGFAMLYVIHEKLPESPRWLASRGRIEEAEAIVGEVERMMIARGYRLDSVDDAEVERHTVNAARAMEGDRREARRRIVRRTLAATASLFAMNYFIYTFTSWAPTVLFLEGAPASLSLGMTAVIAAGAPFGIFLLMVFADRHGRKVGLVAGPPILALLFAAWYNVSLTGAASTMLLGFVLCAAAYYHALLACSVYLGELYPTRIRARCAGVANALGRIASILAPFMVSTILGLAGDVAVISLAALSGVIAVIAALVVALLGAETRYRTLEDINEGL